MDLLLVDNNFSIDLDVELKNRVKTLHFFLTVYTY